MRKSLIAFVAVLVAAAAFAPTAVAAGQANAAERTTIAQKGPTCEYPFEGEDATGQQVTIEEEPESVVVLQPSDAQIMFEIGAEGKLAGMPVNEYTAYLNPDEDLALQLDGNGVPVAEDVVDRNPDVVLAASHVADDDVIDQLRDAGLTVYVFPTEESLDGVAENVRLTGEIVGECEGAQETLDWMDERLGIIEEATANVERPLALYAMGGGYTAGEATFQHEILTTAGVENLGAEAGIQGWAEISDEVVVEEDPEWIIYGDSFEEPPVGEAAMGTTAYENEQFVAVDANFMNQPGPLVVQAIEEIVQQVHPDAYEEAEAAIEDADGSGTSDDGNESGASDADDETDAGAEANDSIPGLGAPAAVAALLAVVGAVSRRP
ncbi:PGF-CTERM-anchored ABC transporter substrate-binding protein [Halosolutus gelatinilyticus]|uniref:PGF-CTERM-anchored ABC transporter substrate-binding protein n=1 Tax=Halosolutus gelatinilyticus TaxID=2931975 RepID=UPI001FF5293F|nr:PGF-CTERM-anchored ABC transporter substrate-binding protein [Halosolutus gelatinilyticus]